MQATKQLSELLPEDFTVTKLNREPFVFLEGPVWDKKRQKLFFTDPLDQTVIRMDGPGDFQVILRDSGYANGMCLSQGGNLVICKMDTGSINEVDPETGCIVGTIAAGYRGRPFHATNDVICDGRGGYYITDPFFTYGPRTQDTEATYYRAPSGEILRVASDSKKPNGLALSPDEKYLYIDDTGSAGVWRYEVKSDGTLQNGVVFCRLCPPENAESLPEVKRFGEADGMKADVMGNIYVTTYTGIQVFNAQGEALGTIPMPGDESASNIVFGGADLKTLYITARTSLYAVELIVPGC